MPKLKINNGRAAIVFERRGDYTKAFVVIRVVMSDGYTKAFLRFDAQADLGSNRYYALSLDSAIRLYDRDDYENIIIVLNKLRLGYKKYPGIEQCDIKRLEYALNKIGITLSREYETNNSAFEYVYNVTREG